MVAHWNDVERFTLTTATADLEARGEVHPLLVAFTGDDPCFFAFLRWFPKGEYHDAMIELLALAMPLRADRLAFAAAGRLTSLDDPIPPVSADGDLRQRALVVEYVDGHGGPILRHSLIHPFALAGRTVHWEPTVRLTDGRGWIAEALEVCVEGREGFAATATDDAISEQALRCVSLGHDLYMDRAVSARLGLEEPAR